MPPKVIWGSLMTKISIGRVDGQKFPKLWGKNLQKVIWVSLMTKLCIGEGGNNCKNTPNNKNLHFESPKLQNTPKFSFALNSPESHLGVSNDPNLYFVCVGGGRDGVQKLQNNLFFFAPKCNLGVSNDQFWGAKLLSPCG